MRSSAHTNLILVSVMLFVLLGFLSYELYGVHRETMDSNRLSLEVASHSTSDQFVKELATIQATHSADLALLDSAVVRKENLVPFLEKVEEIGSAVGLKAKISSVSGDQTTTTASTGIKLTLETEGRFAETLNFIHALENLPYRLAISNVRITTSLGERGGRVSPLWQGNIDLTLPNFQ